MQTRVILVSDDSDFFEYITPKLSVRKSDEIFKFNFADLPDKIHFINSSLLIINSENNKQQTLELLSIVKDNPAIVFSYNEDEEFKLKCYKEGMFAYFTLSTSDEEINAKFIPALKLVASLEQSDRYRELLVNNKLITKNNEVYLDCNNLLDSELEKIHLSSQRAVLGAISPDDKSKFIIQSNQIETMVLNNIRKNDLLINYAPNKYFLLLYNTDIEKAQILWKNITTHFTENVFAAFTSIGKKNRQQLVNEVLNKLHLAMNKGFSTSTVANAFLSGGNFKFFREEFNKKIKQIIAPVFYHIQQFYNDKLFGMKIEQGVGDGYSVLYIKSKNATGSFRITSPGFSTINIDIEFSNNSKHTEEKNESKRISLEPEELEEGLLQDLLEQFISEFKRKVEDVST